MNKILIFLALILAGGSLKAQTVDVEWGPWNELAKKSQVFRVAGSDRNNFYSVRVEKAKPLNASQVWLDIFSTTTMALNKSVDLKPPKVFSKESAFEDLFYIKEKLVLFVSVIDGVRQRKTLYAMIIDDSGTPKSEPRQVGDIPLLNEEGFGFHFKLNHDKSQVVVAYHNPFSLYNGEPIFLKMVDSNAEITTSQEFNLKNLPYRKVLGSKAAPVSAAGKPVAATKGELITKDTVLSMMGRKLELLAYSGGSNGNLYLAARAEPLSKKKSTAAKGARPKQDYFVVVYSPTKAELRYYPVEVDKFLPANLTMALDRDENMVFFGFGTKKSAPDFAGIYYCRINPRTERVEAKDFKDFSKDRNFVMEFKAPRNGENNDQFYSFRPGEVVFLESGAAVFITEQYFETSRVIIDPKTKAETLVRYFHYNDIIAASVDEDGKFEWSMRSPKKQFSTNDYGYYSSFTAVAADSKVKVMYNDHPRNLDQKDFSKIKEISNNIATNPEGQATVLTIFRDGHSDKARLFPDEDSKTAINPKLIFPLGNGYMIYGEKGNLMIPSTQTYKWGNILFE